MGWSAAQYSKFEDERTRPVRDLIARIPGTQVSNAVDLGCGPGNSTELLQERFPDAAITGIDNSIDMVEAARKRLPKVAFEIADIACWADPCPFDIILANASLQWVPGHERLFPQLMSKLSAAGSLAVQMPDNLDEPSHVLMRDVASDGPWADKLSAASNAREARRSAGWYYRLLRSHAGALDIWRTIYHHPLQGGAAAVVEWFKGSGLRPFLDPLNAEERQSYLARYVGAIARAYPPLPDGTVLLPFPRLFIVATR